MAPVELDHCPTEIGSEACAFGVGVLPTVLTSAERTPCSSYWYHWPANSGGAGCTVSANREISCCRGLRCRDRGRGHRLEYQDRDGCRSDRQAGRPPSQLARLPPVPPPRAGWRVASMALLDLGGYGVFQDRPRATGSWSAGTSTFIKSWTRFISVLMACLPLRWTPVPSATLLLGIAPSRQAVLGVGAVLGTAVIERCRRVSRVRATPPRT